MTDRELIILFKRYYKLEREYTNYIKSISADTPMYKLPTMLEWYDENMRGDTE